MVEAGHWSGQQSRAWGRSQQESRAPPMEEASWARMARGKESAKMSGNSPSPAQAGAQAGSQRAVRPMGGPGTGAGRVASDGRANSWAPSCGRRGATGVCRRRKVTTGCCTFPDCAAQCVSRERLVEGGPGDRPSPPRRRAAGTKVCVEAVAVSAPPHETCCRGAA